MPRLPLSLGAATVVVAGCLCWGCQRSNHSGSAAVENGVNSVGAPSAGLPWFEDVAGKAGIDFQHFDSSTPMHYIQEHMGSGLGWIDYNNDGWPDLLCVQAGPVRPTSAAAPLPTNKLYRNNGNGTFTDVSESLGLARASFGMGCAVGDFDNDGFDDLAVTYVGGIVLYHNEPSPPPLPSPAGGEGKGGGGRRFVDVTQKAGLRDPHWATSCAWGDIDGDGYLDLYVCNYVEVDVDHYRPCEDPQRKVRHICPPTVFPHVTHRLYRNNRDGTFRDITTASGIGAAPPAAGLGVIMTDLDADGRLDIYVANDLKPAYLFHNQGQGRFVEKAMESGCALGPSARMMSGMGVDASDVDGSGRPALVVTDFYHNGHVLFRNRGRLVFQDWSQASGLAGASLLRLGFGAVFADVDLDGRLDVAFANGHVYRNADAIGASFQQEAQLFLGDRSGHFRDVSAQAGDYFRQPRVGRGLAWADFDNDGRPDLAFSHNGGTVALLLNRTANDNAWLGLELLGDGSKSNRNAIGARVEVESNGRKQTRFINGGGSYLSASERRVLIGLGADERATRINVTWPSGRQQSWTNVATRRWWRLREAEEQPEAVHRQPAAR